ncbi:MAG: response regulator transcription factor [Caldilineaceae bacterium]
MLTAYDDDPYVLAALRWGRRLSLKTASSSDLLRSVKDLAAGKSFIDTEVALKVIAGLLQSDPDRSAQRSRPDVLRGVAKGRTNREIKLALSISDRTVQGHLANIFGKLHVTSHRSCCYRGLQNRTPSPSTTPMFSGLCQLLVEQFAQPTAALDHPAFAGGVAHIAPSPAQKGHGQVLAHEMAQTQADGLALCCRAGGHAPTAARTLPRLFVARPCTRTY